MAVAERIPLIVLAGPTAGGKTRLALEMAEQIDAEIVSADSRQIYRRLDIGTAKPTPDERARVRHHLLDVIDVDAIFDAARYASAASAAIAEIRARGRAAIVCGGTGFYLRALLEGLATVPPIPPALRDALRARFAAAGGAELHGELAQLDAEAAARIGPRDHRRLLRALEVAHATGRPLSAWQREHRQVDRPPWRTLFLLLSPRREVLAGRIDERTRSMWRGGLVEETRAVLGAGFPVSAPGLQAIGYREARAVLAGEQSVDEGIEATRCATQRYAKRQRTWFRGVAGTECLSGEESTGAVIARARAFLDAPP